MSYKSLQAATGTDKQRDIGVIQSSRRSVLCTNCTLALAPTCRCHVLTRAQCTQASRLCRQICNEVPHVQVLKRASQGDQCTDYLIIVHVRVDRAFKKFFTHASTVCASFLPEMHAWLRALFCRKLADECVTQVIDAACQQRPERSARFLKLQTCGLLWHV